MSSPLSGLKPNWLWHHFDALRQIPRCSKHEQAAAAYVMRYAEAHGFQARQDAAGNVLVRVPATPGREGLPIVVLQGHLDMVCEKNADKAFDFTCDPIAIRIDDGWVTAEGTTLGADNGIGVAAALAAAEDPECVHGPLELLFTTDEETGLNGARGLAPDFLQGRILLNLDSEEEGVFSIGCAGGADSEITLPIHWHPQTMGTRLSITLRGLHGGHSGIDIHKGFGNAIQLLARILFKPDVPFDLVSIEGGTKHNAIPREAFAQVLTPDPEGLKTALVRRFQEVQFEFKAVEKAMRFSIDPVTEGPDPMDPASTRGVLGLLTGLPHGVMAMSQEIPGLVETSNNLAIVKTLPEALSVYTSTRSSILSALEAVREKIEAVALLAGGTIVHHPGYPAWTPNLDSPILALLKKTYRACTGREAQVVAIHAGLECGIIGEKYPGMDMISFGPDIQNPHSPNERVRIDSVARFYHHLLTTLAAIGEIA